MTTSGGAKRSPRPTGLPRTTSPNPAPSAIFAGIACRPGPGGQRLRSL